MVPAKRLLKKARDFFRHPLVATVVGGVILTIVIAIWKGLRDSLLTVAGSFSHIIWNHLTSTVSLPWGVLYLIAVIFFLAILTRIKAPPKKTGEGGAVIDALQKTPPDTSSYTEDTFFGILWRWELTGYGKLGLKPTGLTPFCPHCDMQLVHERIDQGDNIHFRCESCDRVYSPVMGSVDSVQERVSRDIQRILRTGEWRKKLAKDRE